MEHGSVVGSSIITVGVDIHKHGVIRQLSTEFRKNLPLKVADDVKPWYKWLTAISSFMFCYILGIYGGQSWIKHAKYGSLQIW